MKQIGSHSKALGITLLTLFSLVFFFQNCGDGISRPMELSQHQSVAIEKASSNEDHSLPSGENGESSGEDYQEDFPPELLDYPPCLLYTSPSPRDS